MLLGRPCQRRPPVGFVARLEVFQAELQERLPDEPSSHVEDPGRNLAAHTLDLLEGRFDTLRRADVGAYAYGRAAASFYFLDEGFIVGRVPSEEDNGVSGIVLARCLDDHLGRTDSLANFLATAAPVPGPTPAMIARAELEGAILGMWVAKCLLTWLRRTVGEVA